MAHSASFQWPDTWKFRSYVETMETSQLLMSFPHLLETFQTNDQPDPRNIIGV